ncbi:MAG: major capsid protein [Bosea sp.]|uniref:major capsid protein n=1 Tax=unclassified Bosea (in: a-proteobacteria) TaxID=2653178 RepID=UPI000AF41657|nr:MULTISPECIES: major capsid protein [unclassified Bosea (in: a-proteobacteria)]MBN9459053.1 major capsid protein [Bosea sp. (in: a-proteobacteria)]
MAATQNSTVLDLFDDPVFSARALTDAINLVPNNYGRANELNLFPIRGVATTYVEIEYKNGVLNLLRTAERGARGTAGLRGRRNVRIFKIPHIPHIDALLAADLQNRIPFGATNVLERIQDATNEKLEDMTSKHHITLEAMRMSALDGVLLDADGSVIIDYYAEFGITRKTVDFELDVTTTEVKNKNMEVLRYMEDNLLGETMTSARALCSPEFFDAYTTHPNVKAAYQYYTSQQEVLRNDVRRGFKHANIFWEEYRGNANYVADDGSVLNRKFIPAGEARIYPEGTRQTFQTYLAPPDAMSEVNSAPGPDQLIYVTQERLDHDAGIEFKSQSNPLPLNKRPALVVTATI